MVLPEALEKLDQSKFMAFLMQQGLVGILLVVLIGLNAYSIIWVQPANDRQIASESRAEMRQALQDANLAHARAEEANAKAFTDVVDRLERLFGLKRGAANPIAGARP